MATKKQTPTHLSTNAIIETLRESGVPCYHADIVARTSQAKLPFITVRRGNTVHPVYGYAEARAWMDQRIAEHKAKSAPPIVPVAAVAASPAPDNPIGLAVLNDIKKLRNQIAELQAGQAQLLALWLTPAATLDTALEALDAQH